MWSINIEVLAHLPYYSYIIAGFVIGAYLHSERFHHFIHWICIKSFAGLIFLLKRTDPNYKEPEPQASQEKPIMPSSNRKDTNRITPEQLRDLINNNSDITIQAIRK